MPTWLHFRVKFPPRCPPSCPQDALGRPSLAPKIAQEPPKRRPRCVKSRPRAALEPSRKRPTDSWERRHATRQPQAPSRPRFRTILATIWKPRTSHGTSRRLLMRKLFCYLRSRRGGGVRSFAALLDLFIYLFTLFLNVFSMGARGAQRNAGPSPGEPQG